MKTIKTVRLSILIASVFLALACRSAQRGPDVTIVENGVLVNPGEYELTLVAADSQVFAGVVRTQLAADEDDYPRRLERVRFDARPYGTPTGYPEVFSGVQGIDPTLTFARAEKSQVNRLVENRKVILEENGTREGGIVTFSQCAGVGVPTPPPPRTASRARKPADVHAGCPKNVESFITVGLPIRGLPEGLTRSRDTRGRRVSLRGDLWTTVVDEHSVGPTGWSRSQYAWVFERKRSGKLELATTILIGVVQ